jgi:hypothetical protein
VYELDRAAFSGDTRDGMDTLYCFVIRTGGSVSAMADAHYTAYTESRSFTVDLDLLKFSDKYNSFHC